MASVCGRLESREPAPGTGVGDATTPVRAEAQHAAVTSHADSLAPSRPQLLKRWHDPITRPRSDAVDDGLVQLIHRHFGVFECMTDGRNDLLLLLWCQPDSIRKGGAVRDRGQCCGPDRKIINGQQVYSAARTVRLDQAVLVPQRAPNSRPGGSLDAQGD